MNHEVSSRSRGYAHEMGASQMLSQLYVVQRLWLFILVIGENLTGIFVCFVFEKVILIFLFMLTM